MSVDSLLFWLFVAAWAVVIALIVVVLLRIVGEVQRSIKHVGRLVDNSPLPMKFAKAESDAMRIESVVATVPSLQLRVATALELIRESPWLPPELVEIYRRVQFEIAAFRAER